MSTTLYVNGVPYPFPTNDDPPGWGNDVTSWATAVSNALFPIGGGTLVLTGDLSFGPNYGLITTYLEQYEASAPIAATGFVRMANGSSLNWRNYVNSNDIGLTLDSSDNLNINTNVSATGNVYAGGNLITAGEATVTAGTINLASIKLVSSSTDLWVTNGTTGTPSLHAYSTGGHIHLDSALYGSPATGDTLYIQNSTASTIVGGNLYSQGNFAAQSGTASTSYTTGAAVITGGLGVSGDAYINGNAHVAGLITMSSYATPVVIATANSPNLQFGGGASSGFYGDGTNIAIRQQNNSGSIYFQNVGGSTTYATINSSGVNIGTGTFNGNLSGNAATATTATNATNATNASYAANQGGGTNNTLIANTAFVQAALAAGIAQSAASPGYIKLAGGLILQWGYKQSTGGAGTQTYVAFPVSFPTAFLAGVCSTLRNSGGSGGYNHIWSPSTAGMYCIWDQQSGINGYSGGYWFAIGH